MTEIRYVTVCPIARCAKVIRKPSREETVKASKQHWQRVHGPYAVSSPNGKESR